MTHCASNRPGQRDLLPATCLSMHISVHVVVICRDPLCVHFVLFVSVCCVMLRQSLCHLCHFRGARIETARDSSEGSKDSTDSTSSSRGHGALLCLVWAVGLIEGPVMIGMWALSSRGREYQFRIMFCYVIAIAG